MKRSKNGKHNLLIGSSFAVLSILSIVIMFLSVYGSFNSQSLVKDKEYEIVRDLIVKEDIDPGRVHKYFTAPEKLLDAKINSNIVSQSYIMILILSIASIVACSAVFYYTANMAKVFLGKKKTLEERVKDLEDKLYKD